MNSLWLLTKKNLRLLIRSKSSALIVFLAPLLIILVLGLSFDTSSQYGINIGVYSSSFTNDVNSLIASLETQGMTITTYEVLDNCVEDIKLGFNHACVSVPESLDVKDNKKKEVSFYLDPSKINLVWMIQESLKTEFNLQSQQMTEQLTGEILNVVLNTNTKLKQRINELEQIKVKTNSLTSTIGSTKGSLSTVDVTIQETGYDPDVLNNFRVTIKAKLNSIIDDIDDAVDEVNGLNASSSEKNSVKNYLNNADDELNESLGLINGSGSNNLNEVNRALITLQEDLNEAKEKLSQASSSISSATNNLNSINTILNEEIIALNNLQSGLGGIQQELDHLKITDASIIANPLETHIESITPEKTYLNYIFPALLILVIMFSSLLLGTTLVMLEKHSPAFLRNYFLPVKRSTFVASIYLTNLILILIQISVILLVSIFFLTESITLFPIIAIILFISASVFTFLGMIMGYVFYSEETGILASISLGSLLLFTSGLIVPLESISPTLRKIMSFNPFVLAEKLVKEIFIFNAHFDGLWVDLLILICYGVILFMSILIVESVIHKHLAKKFIKKHRHQHKDEIHKVKISKVTANTESIHKEEQKANKE